MLNASGVFFVLAAALGWTAVISIDGYFESAPTLLMGLGMILTSTVGMVGVLVTSGRWAHRLALASLAMGIAVAWSAPVDALWLAAMGVTAVALLALFRPSLVIRKLPSATGPPPKAVMTPLLLLAAPFVYGITGDSSPSWTLLAVGLTAPVAAFLYARVVPGGLISVRYLWPALALGLALVFETSTAIASVALAMAVAFLAWSPEAKTAFHPPREMGTSYPIPPELSPEEILEAAEIDEKGRRR